MVVVFPSEPEMATTRASVKAKNSSISEERIAPAATAAWISGRLGRMPGERKMIPSVKFWRYPSPQIRPAPRAANRAVSPLFSMSAGER